MSRRGYWGRYVPVAERRAKARKRMNQLKKKGMTVRPVEIEGRKIARTFWGTAWCDHIESFSDYANRLPRGRTYVRNGSVCHLDIESGEISAMVSGSKMYTVTISIDRLPSKKWAAVRNRCAGRIGSILELLEGRLSENVMDVVTDRKEGLFPLPGEIHLGCSCPDWADMCKHVAAVLYGVGARLDEQPDLLFRLRDVDPEELIQADMELNVADGDSGSRRRIAEDALGDVFGIDMDPEGGEGAGPAPPRKAASPAKKKRSAKAAGGGKSAPQTADGKTKRIRTETAAKTQSPGGKSGKSAKTADSSAATSKSGKSAAPADAKRGASETAGGNHRATDGSTKTGSRSGRSAKGNGKKGFEIKTSFRIGRKPPPATRTAVVRLRERFGMTQAEFAELLGVSAATVSKWENSSGPLRLQRRTRAAWDEVSRWKKDRAWRELEGE